jgi:hypothetical protein
MNNLKNIHLYVAWVVSEYREELSERSEVIQTATEVIAV